MAEPFINGGYAEFSGLDRMTIVDPSNGEEVDSVPASGAAEVDQAVQSASAAFPAWRDTPAAKRGEIVGVAAHTVLGGKEAGDTALRAHAGALRGPRQEHPGRVRARPGRGHLRPDREAPFGRRGGHRALELPHDTSGQQAW